MAPKAWLSPNMTRALSAEAQRLALRSTDPTVQRLSHGIAIARTADSSGHRRSSCQKQRKLPQDLPTGCAARSEACVIARALVSPRMRLLVGNGRSPLREFTDREEGCIRQSRRVRFRIPAPTLPSGRPVYRGDVPVGSARMVVPPPTSVGQNGPAG